MAVTMMTAITIIIIGALNKISGAFAYTYEHLRVLQTDELSELSTSFVREKFRSN
jgi:hypothetical protein